MHTVMSLDWFNIRKCILPDLQEIFKAIRFVRLKIDYSKKEIVQKYEIFKKKLLEDSRKKLRYDLRMNHRLHFIDEESRSYDFAEEEINKTLKIHPKK